MISYNQSFNYRGEKKMLHGVIYNVSILSYKTHLNLKSLANKKRRELNMRKSITRRIETMWIELDCFVAVRYGISVVFCLVMKYQL